MEHGYFGIVQKSLLGLEGFRAGTGYHFLDIQILPILQWVFGGGGGVRFCQNLNGINNPHHAHIFVQYNKLSDIQYARFHILPVDLHFETVLVSWYPHHATS